MGEGISQSDPSGEQVIKMQIPERADIERGNYGLLKKNLPNYIEEFISRKESPSTRNVFKLESPIRFAVRNDATQIVSVNHQVYKGYYPYRDMLDVEYVSEFASDRKRGIIGIYETDDTRAIGGFLLLAVDREQRKGYFRGLMVSPEYRNRLHLKNRVLETVYQGFKQYYQDVDLWFGETRTAHIIGQKWMEEVGSRPCAFLPNKDIFSANHIRESDVLEAAYTHKGMHQLRNTEPLLLPEFESLYDRISQYYGFPDISFISCANTPSKVLQKAQDTFQQCVVQKIPSLYQTHILSIQTKNGSSLQFLVNEVIGSAEKAVLHTSTPQELAILLLFLKSYMVKEGLHYFEIYIPATNLEFQRVFLDLGFSCFGYLPAWKHERNQLHDCILFGLFRSPIDWKTIYLTEDSSELVKNLRPFLNVF